MRHVLLAGILLVHVHGLRAQEKPAAEALLGGGQRLTHAAWSALPTPDGVSFATGVIGYSSQYATTGWAATDAVGFPNVYPRHGDLTGAWAPATTTSAREVLSLSFTGAPTQEIWIFETYGVGGLYEVHDISGGTSVLLWRGAPGPVAVEARVLRITLPAARPISGLQLVVNPSSVGTYPELDAVAIVPTLAGPQLPGGHQ
jgi:hypothetical protein